MNAVESILSRTQTEQFYQDGFLIFRAMVAPEACEKMLRVVQDHLQHAVSPIEYEAQLGYPGAPTSMEAIGGRTIRRLRSAYQRSACFQDWADNLELRVKLAELLGEEVCLTLAHHNCIMTKHPDFGTATGWHRDIRYWSFARPDLISVWLALGDETASNGALKFIPGSHRMPIAPEQMDDLDFLLPDHPANQALFKHSITPQLQQGDVVFFHSKLFHAAGKNTSQSVKTSVVFAYRGKSNLPIAGTRSATEDLPQLGCPNP